MTDITPKYFDHPDYCIRFLEWQAFKVLVFGKDHMAMIKYFEAFSQRYHKWHDYYLGKRKDGHSWIMYLINEGTFNSIDEFYESMSKLLKPRKLGKALKDAKKRT
ncbi:hypothetical protein OAN83_02600 [Alphaproteobacteria bacterium]|nr:hypothetical protein [Alphaproteobacteria bacterium]